MSDLFLTRDEVAELTGWKTKTKQIQHLRTLGMRFWINGQGLPVVPRSAIEGLRPPSEPARVKVTAPAFLELQHRDEKGNWIPPGLRTPKKA
ncbi:DUF4224 domain-containing protein [Massilia sp. PAMC28688]|uniref:DUF4224 domain-containing protein n=1 Tax=Massilia sp. PAMC28688 TaxID=2861283 RepID=UPI001C634E21|nr:DUF4224 domain-containing protein [Massilia sp. PAMC28688]